MTEEPTRRTLLRTTGALVGAGALSTLTGPAAATDASAPPELRWNRTYDFEPYDWGTTLLETDDGDYAVFGRSGPEPSKVSGTAFVVDGESSRGKWKQSFDAGNVTLPLDAVTTDDGGFLVCGITGADLSASSRKAFLAKLNGDGSPAWSKTYTTETGTGEFYGIAAVDGGYVLAGRGYQNGLQATIGWLTKVDTEGERQWQSTFDAKRYNNFLSLTASDGGVVAAGSSQEQSEDSESRPPVKGWVVSVDGDGATRWQERYTDAEDGDPYKQSVAQTIVATDDGYLLAGQSTQSLTTTDTSGWAVAIGPDGSKQNMARYSPGKLNIIGRIDARDGDYYFAGQTFAEREDGSGLAADAWVGALGADGSMTWQAKHSAKETTVGQNVLAASDGGVVFTGQTAPRNSEDPKQDAWLLKRGGDSAPTPTPEAEDDDSETPTDTPTPSPTPTPTPTATTTATPSPTPTPTPTATPTETTTTASGPGFGTGAALAALGGGALLQRLRSDDTQDDEREH